MPYISIKAFPKDEETKNKVVEKINQILLETWGCPQKAISISVEEIKPEDWNEKVRIPEINAKADKMKILDGEKKY